MPETLNDLDGRAWAELTQSWFTIPARTEPGWDLKRDHPQSIPIALVERLLTFFTKPGDVVLDPFMGSGTTLCACRKMGRNGVGIEMERDYFHLASRMIRKHYPTGEGRTKLIFGEASDVLERELAEWGRGKVEYAIVHPSTPPHDKRFGFQTTKWLAVTMFQLMKPGKYMTLIIDNDREKSTMIPQAWELALAIEENGRWELVSEQIWVRSVEGIIKGFPTTFVSNNSHTYLIHFRRGK